MGLPVVAGVLLLIITLNPVRANSVDLIPGPYHQRLVTPRRHARPQVRWQEVQWQILNVPIGDGVSLMLYYPEHAERTASQAARVILQNLRTLERAFNYRLEQPFMYVLYDTQASFQQTHLFPIGEGTLGVTDPQRLHVALFYDGDHQNFQRISMHELAHQFTVQQVNHVTRTTGTSWSPLMRMPLWFIEGLAEYRAFLGDLNPETHAYLRDLVQNPAPRRWHWLRPFFADDLSSVIQVYRVGHAKVFFLSETYGPEILQQILEESYRLVPGRRSTQGPPSPELPGSPAGDAPLPEPPQSSDAWSFPMLVSSLAQEPVEVIEERYRRWAQWRFGCINSQDPEDPIPFRLVGPDNLVADRFVVSKDGKLALLRHLDRHTFTTYLDLLILAQPNSNMLRVTEDNRPGLSSLHPFGRRGFALGENLVATSGRTKGVDVIDVRPFALKEDNRGRLRLHLQGKARRYHPVSRGIIQVKDPVFSPDGERLAFVGLDRNNQLDLWSLELSTGDLHRLTDSPHAKRDPDWGEAGMVYASDATPDGRLSLFWLDPHHPPAAPKRGRPSIPLVSMRGEDLERPSFLSPTTISYSSTDSGTPQVWILELGDEWQTVTTSPHEEWGDHEGAQSHDHAYPHAVSRALPDSRVFRATDHPVGIWDPQPTSLPEGSGSSIYGRTVVQGAYRLTAISQSDVLRQDERAALPSQPGTPWTLPQEPVGQLSRPYNPWRWDSWSFDQVFLAASTGLFGFAYLTAGDQMRDRLMLIQATSYGALDLMDASALYLNRSRRMNWGLELFHQVNTRRDPNLDSQWLFGPLFLERQYGGRGLVAYPLSNYSQASFSLGAEGRSRNAPYGLNDNRETRQWEERFGGPLPALVSSIGLGFNSLRYQFFTGPVQGFSVDFQLHGAYLPSQTEGDVTGTLDMQRYFRVGDRANLGWRLAGGLSLSSRFYKDFLVTSWDNLRGFAFDDPILQGPRYLVSNLEFQFPLNAIVAVGFVDDMEAVMALDAGSVFHDPADAWDHRSLAAVLGTNALLGPIVLRLHFGYPFNIGGIAPSRKWVTQFSARYLFW